MLRPPMRIRVQAFGMVRDLLRRSDFMLDLPQPATVLSAVTQIVDAAGPDARRLILSPDGTRLKIVVRLDGETARPDTPLYEGAGMKMMLGQH